MIRFFLMLGCVVFFCLLASCARQVEKPAESTPWKKPWQSEKPLPTWVADPTDHGRRMAAYGSAEYVAAETRSDQTNRAVTKARAEISRMIRVRLQEVVKDFVAVSGEGVTNYFESATKQTVDETLTGSYQLDEWTNEKTDELFVLVVMDPGFAKKIATSVAQAAKNPSTGDPKLDAHLRAKAGSDEAFAELDRQLEKKLLGDGGAKK